MPCSRRLQRQADSPVRLGIEHDHEAQAFGQGLKFLHVESLLFSHHLIEGVLRLTGLYWQGRRNAGKIRAGVLTAYLLGCIAFVGYVLLEPA